MEKLLKGWLSPTGEFVETDIYEHIAKAREILGNKPYNKSPDTELENLGWVSITRSALFSKEWCIYWKRYLTPEQESFLKNYFESSEPIAFSSKCKWDAYQDRI